MTDSRLKLGTWRGLTLNNFVYLCTVDNSNDDLVWLGKGWHVLPFVMI